MEFHLGGWSELESSLLRHFSSGWLSLVASTSTLKVDSFLFSGSGGGHSHQLHHSQIHGLLYFVSYDDSFPPYFDGGFLYG